MASSLAFPEVELILCGSVHPWEIRFSNHGLPFPNKQILVKNCLSICMCVYVLRHVCSQVYHGVLVEAGEQFGGVGSLLPSYELLGSKSLHLAWQQASLPTEPAPRPLQVRRHFFFKPENPFLYCSKHVSCLRTKASAFSISCWAHISGVLGQ